ncbi:MAG: hypothetical protein Q9M19_07655 [Mariprofundaceae bacterium]|nr:hypothetical protein [Mariprofundaceae bacterium]
MYEDDYNPSKSALYQFRKKTAFLRDYYIKHNFEWIQLHWKCRNSYNAGYEFAKGFSPNRPVPEVKDPNSFYMGFKDRLADTKVGRCHGHTKEPNH